MLYCFQRRILYAGSLHWHIEGLLLIIDSPAVCIYLLQKYCILIERNRSCKNLYSVFSLQWPLCSAEMYVCDKQNYFENKQNKRRNRWYDIVLLDFMLQLVMGMAEKDTTTNWTTTTFWPCSVYLSGKYASSMFWHIIKYGSYKNRAGFTPSGHISA